MRSGRAITRATPTSPSCGRNRAGFNDALVELDNALVRNPPELIRADLEIERALLLWRSGKYQAALEACEAILASRTTATEVLGDPGGKSCWR